LLKIKHKALLLNTVAGRVERRRQKKAIFVVIFAGVAGVEVLDDTERHVYAAHPGIR
jgi:hypothetical protein